MTFGFGKQSRAMLAGVHPDLVKVAELAITLSPVDFRITEGLRSLSRQKRLVETGASRTLNSRHLTGHAIDVVALIDGQVHWDWPLYAKIATAFKEAARRLGVPIVWGGDWRTLKDGPHFELDRKRYP